MLEHHKPKGFSDHYALFFTKFLRFIADTFFKKRYGHRAVILETVAAVPGMVAGMWIHLKSLRKLKKDNGLIKLLLDEAENERMHLMVYLEIAKPNFFERCIILLAQLIFWHLYFIMYLISAKTCHRIIGYFEEEAVKSYTEYLKEIDSDKIKNIPAPEIAIKYWNLPENATLRDVVIATRNDEIDHSLVNHNLSNNWSNIKI